MYYLKKTLEVCGAHNLCLDYDSPCQNVHGHNYIITIYCKSETLNHNGMIIDFSAIKEVVMKFDHTVTNNVIPDLNPTAENMAKWLVDQIPSCYRADVEETKNNVASYERD
jgi:6-pyruvoyltetrahydropterin/6-carboxytetrahydropterin synthase